MIRCPKCNEIWEPCSECRAGTRHQYCINDSMCHDCFMDEKWPNKPVEPTAEVKPTNQTDALLSAAKKLERHL